MYERKHEALLPWNKFFLRVLRHIGLAFSVILVSLALGMLGYRYIAGLTWMDALLNASMILSGMGPVNPLSSDAAKLFASAYALFSGMVFLVIIGVVLAPILHRVLHYLHLESDSGDDPL